MRYMNKLLGLTLGMILASAPMMAQAQEAAPDAAGAAIHAPKGEMRARHHKGEMRGQKPDKAELEKKMAEKREAFANRLGLTEEQRAKSKELHEKNKTQMKQIMSEMGALKEKAQALREESKKEFEALLTAEQKETLKQMQAEREAKQKERGEKHRKGFEGKKHRPHHEGGKPQDK